MEIQIDSAGLTKIANAGQVVTLTHHVDQTVEAIAPSRLTVAWQAFAPLQTNTVNWSDQYYCFMTTTPLIMNNVIMINAEYPSPVQTGFVYQFAQGQFTMVQQSQGTNCYVISNAAQQGSYAFGLAQSATVNSVLTLAPCCVAPVLYNEEAYFCPSGEIGVFLSSASAAGALLPPPSNALNVLVNSGSGNGPIIGFNDQTNSFYLISQERSS